MQRIHHFRNIPYTLGLLFTMLLVSYSVQATHLRAGQITAERISSVSLTYRITVTIYMDRGQGNADSPSLNVFFGDGNSAEVQRVTEEAIGNNTTRNIYVIEHTYPSPQAYTIYFAEENRNAGVLNMINSVDTPFSVETRLLIDPFVGLNDTPILLADPIDLACVGQKFTHNPAAFDPDGDSLSFTLTVPNQDIEKVVNGYADPSSASFGGRTEAGGTPFFRIDPFTGTLTWDSPGAAGEYNIAFKVEEWRNGVKIGSIVRDMQIIVLDCNNERPRLLLPQDTCVEANSEILKTIRANDPDGHPVRITAESGILESGFNPRATFGPTNFQTGGIPQGTFRWTPSCENIREQPYRVIFKAEDNPTIESPLVDVKAWRITVVGPRPVGLTATPAGRSITLNWSDYSLICANAKELIIWRKEGCSTWEPLCEVGVPAGLGYQEVGRVPASQTTFTDSQRLKKGLKYSYRISAVFPEPSNGQSRASQEVCVSLPLDIPIVTNVTVDQTSATTGQITIKWTKPPVANSTDNYKYDLYHFVGIRGEDSTRTDSTKLLTLSADTSFIHQNINTLDTGHTYRVLAYIDNGTPIFDDYSELASSVDLTAVSAPSSIKLNWTYDVPWANIKHLIYRQASPGGAVHLIDSLPQSSSNKLEYFDKGTFQDRKLDTDSTYCYYILTVGTYSNPDIKIADPDSLANLSQVACAQPTDTTAPCPPRLAIDSIKCESFNDQALLQNSLSWTPVINIPAGCDDDIVQYKLYFRPTNQGDFTLLTSLTQGELSYIHANLTSLAGCYYVTAVDRLDNESDPSNIVCQDNCTYYELPNIITPNKDGKNDVFRPFPTPRFVESVEFKVYNRWGVKVFEISDNIMLDWDGSSNGSDQVLPSGMYYYSAKVKFITLDPNNSVQKLKGWIKLRK
ncbi:T9SS C-terminal target domain-containing protein [Microscilla marina]|uniref:Fibronectin type III domain protein n=1 Tax=Microscilla marina ATCC 23134 TaxID=313606 RepID=A1ZTX5_MICM2|nr:T9SS C-terminal target domain-containing protein [Microscilla marina]EAY26227.1 hypothetical protein M23134_02559 [Microscilla marina ATCC 23134]